MRYAAKLRIALASTGTCSAETLRKHPSVWPKFCDTGSRSKISQQKQAASIVAEEELESVGRRMTEVCPSFASTVKYVDLPGQGVNLKKGKLQVWDVFCGMQIK